MEFAAICLLAKLHCTVSVIREASRSPGEHYYPVYPFVHPSVRPPVCGATAATVGCKLHGVAGRRLTQRREEYYMSTARNHLYLSGL